MIALPDGIRETDDLLVKLDQCWLAGFAYLSPAHKQTLSIIREIFADTALGTPLAAAIAAIDQGSYQPQHLHLIAVARASLQGAQYEHLRQAVNTQLKRLPLIPSAVPSLDTTPTEPILKGVAHWLMDIAIEGYARLDTRALSAFDSTLMQLQAIPERMPMMAILNGLIDELSVAVPVKNPQDVPLFRWCDLWCRAMLMTGTQPAPTAQPVSGTLYLMGAECRNQPRLFSVVFYGILTQDARARWVRTTFSTYKVSIIAEDELWLLLPETQVLIQAFRAGQALEIQEMTLLSTGDLLWDNAQAAAASPFSFSDIAGSYLSPDATETLEVMPAAPEKRHPVHLAEPLMLSNYTDDGRTIQAADLHLPVRYSAGDGLPELKQYKHLVGLLRYDDQQVYLQPLAVAKASQPPIFTGIENRLTLFDLPSKDSAIVLLRERASRLLREK